MIISMSFTKESRARIALRLLAVKGQTDTLERLHCAIEHEITASSKTIQRAKSSGDEDLLEAITEEECLAVEELLALAFVAAQSFINSIRSELEVVGKTYEHEFGSRPNFPTHPNDVLKVGAMLPAGNCSVVEAINAIANYWKHSEEWEVVDEQSNGRVREVWDRVGVRPIQKRTVEVVSALGLTPGSSGNLRKAAQALGVKELADLSPIRKNLSDWAAELLKQARTGFGVKP
jgi:hypothetical protein